MIDLVLKGPGKNALGTPMMDHLLDQLREASGMPVLLSGDADAFCAGLDLKELSQLDASGLEGFLRKLEAVVETLYTYPGPIVAAVNGHAIAGGCVLALCCDHQVSASNPKIKIGLNELALGLVFPPVTLAVVRDRVPKRHLNRVVLAGQLHDPTSALHLGLVDEIADDARAVARERLALLASHPPQAYASAKREIRGAVIGESNEEKFLQALPTWTSTEVKRRIDAALKR